MSCVDPVAEIPKETSNKKSTPKINHVQRLEDQSAAIKKKGKTCILITDTPKLIINLPIILY